MAKRRTNKTVVNSSPADSLTDAARATILKTVAAALKMEVSEVKESTLVAEAKSKHGLSSVEVWNLMEALEDKLLLKGKLTELNQREKLTLADVFQIVVAAMQTS